MLKQTGTRWMIWNTNMDEAPKDQPLFLDLGDRGFAFAQWHEPWGVWIHESEFCLAMFHHAGEIFGIGADIPVAWMQPFHAETGE